MTELTLDRTALDDVGLNPQRLAEAIHEQLGDHPLPVPVHKIALALDIVEIREEQLAHFEGALVTNAERDRGSIVVNSKSGRQRRRYSIGHELLHFLNPRHRPPTGNGFQCSRSDMIEANLNHKEAYYRQEAEANTFSIELLAPRTRVRKFLMGKPNLTRVLTMANELDLSREACARRYAELHSETLAVVFSRHGQVMYTSPSRDFPALALFKGDMLPDLPAAVGGLSELKSVHPGDWLRTPAGVDLATQTLIQQDGFATTMLWLADVDPVDDLEDTAARFDRI